MANILAHMFVGFGVASIATGFVALLALEREGWVVQTVRYGVVGLAFLGSAAGMALCIVHIVQ